MPESEPTRLIVEKAGVDTPLIRLGVQEDGTVGVPKGDPGAPAGWYEYSPTPGEVGPSVYLGHVYDTGGEGVFIDLNVLVPGDRVRVPRKDGTEAVFEVYKAEYYGKGREEFPTEQVYGNTAGPEIRLITCDGYDPATGHWNDNLVVYGRLVAG